MNGNESELKYYTVRVKTETTVNVEARNIDEAYINAGTMYWTLDPDSTEMEIMEVDEA